MSMTFQKRQKELKRQEKQRAKAEKREQRKAAKRAEQAEVTPAATLSDSEEQPPTDNKQGDQPNRTGASSSFDGMRVTPAV